MQNIHIAHTIKELCKLNNLTVTDLLSNCGISKSFIYDLEKRSTSPSCEKISIIADFFNVSVDYLLGRSDNSVTTNIPNNSLDAFNTLSKNSQNKLNEYIEYLIFLEEKQKLENTSKTPKKQKLENIINIVENNEKLEKEYIELPLYEQKASAGLGRYLLDKPEHTIEQFELKPFNRQATHVFTIQGESMQPTIQDGENVFVKQQPRVEHNEIGMFVLNDEMFCKRLILENNKIILRSDNIDYKDIVIKASDYLITIGKVLLNKEKSV